MPIPLLAPFAIVAQVPVLSAPVAVPPPGFHLSVLSQALGQMAWRPAEQGVLLIVGAESVSVPDFQKRMQRNQLPTLPPPGATAANVAALFDYGVEKVGSLFIFVPKKVKHFLGAPNVAPEDAEPVEDYEVGRELSRSLTAGQWKQMASERGLGIDGLNPAQQKMYLQILPDPIRVRPTGGDGSGNQEPIELNDEQRRQVRIVLDRNLTVYFAATGRDNSSFGFGEPPGKNERKFYLEFEGNERNKATEAVAPLVPNKLKLGDLNFASRTLDERVSLKDVKTVGELMGRIREATGQASILADARLHGRSVKAWGDEARSGDVLKALCRAFGGTFRRVGEGDDALYVLTEDRLGLGTRSAAYQEWRNLAQLLRSADRQNELDKSAESLDFQSLTPLDDPWGLPERTVSEIQKRMRGSSKWEDRLTDVSSLPPKLQEFVQKQVKDHPSVSYGGEQGEQQVAIRSDKVSVQSQYRVQLLIPNVGKTDAWQFSSLASGPMSADYRRNPPSLDEKPAEPLRYPDKWRDRAVLARPKDAADCAKLAKAARANGFGALWIDLPNDLPAARKLIADAVAAGKSEGVSVGAQVSVFLAAVPDAALDVTIRGEPSNAEGERMMRALEKIRKTAEYAFSPYGRAQGVYLEPNPENYAALTRELTLLARTPGLSALILSGLTPPGYARPTNDGYYSFGGNVDLGYSLKNRLSFLRQESIDPIDLGPGLDSRFVPEAFVVNGPNYIDLGNGRYGPDPKYRNPARLWSELRAKLVEDFTAPLHSKLRAAAPDVRLFVPQDNTFSGYFGEWLKPDARPAAVGSPWDDSQKIARARGFSTFILNRMPYYYGAAKDEKQRVEFRKAMRESLRRETKQFGPAGATWNGFVVDLTLSPTDDYAAALSQYKEDPK